MGVVRSSGKSPQGDTCKDSFFFCPFTCCKIRTESRAVKDTLKVGDLDSVGVRDKDIVREAFGKNGKHFGPRTLRGATSAVTRY